MRAYARRWRKENPEKARAANDNWRKNNPERWVELRDAADDRRKSTPKGKVEAAVRSGIARGITPGSKAGRRSFGLVGYTPEQLRAHLERLFLPGMSWSNYGKWHIDHKVPLAAFNYETPDHIDFKRAWSLKNLQPLWANDNLKKHNKLEGPFQPSLAI